MTAQSDEGHTGLNRQNNRRPDVNEEGKEGKIDPASGDAMQERKAELTGDSDG